jgi:hypothetical protein
MCDFSLQAVASRPAKVGDKLVTTDFKTGTSGFAAVNDPTTAVCLLPGTELAFDDPIYTTGWFMGTISYGNVARFKQVDKHILHAHHDALELPNGDVVKLTILASGQTAIVLQLPAAPKNDQEAEEQRRVAFAG